MRQSKSATLLFSLFVLLTLTNCRWLQFRYDATHSGQNQASALTPTTAQSLLPKAVFDSNLYGYDVFSTEVAVDILGVWPNLTTVAFEVGSSYGTVYAIDLNTPLAPPLWTNYTRGVVLSSPAVDSSRSAVYVVDLDQLYAFDEKKGTLLWYAGPMYHNDGDNPSPTVADSISAGGVSLVYVAAFDGHIYGFNPLLCGKSGGLCKPSFVTATMNFILGTPFVTSPAVANSTVFIADFTGTSAGMYFQTVYAFNQKTGSVKWITMDGPVSANGDSTSSPAVLNGVVYVESNVNGVGYLRAYNAATGTPCWTSPPALGAFTSAKAVIYSSPAVVTENGAPFAYVGTTNGLYKIDASCTNLTGGTVIWGPKIKSGDQITYSSPSVANAEPSFFSKGTNNEVIFFGSQNGLLYAYDLNGKLITNYPKTFGNGSGVYASPSPASQTVYINDQDGKLYSFQ